MSLVPTEPVRPVVTMSRLGGRFRDPDPSLILVNNAPLDTLLTSMGQDFVFRLRELMRSMDWSAFEARYKTGGRLPYHPSLMMSLILFGTMNGHRSLRELEQFASTDIRCWWLSGGETPDYSTFSKFLSRHEDLVANDFFESLTAEILVRMKSEAKSIAIDGTVMQAAASRFKSITAESAERAAAKARREADRRPKDEVVNAKADEAERIAHVASQRSANQRAKGRTTQTGRVSPTEPEAPIRKLKSGGVAPSYIASVAANEDRVVTGFAVDPTSETGVVEEIIEQTERITGAKVEQVLADAGYIGQEVLTLALDREIDLLCPEGKAKGDRDWTKSDGRKRLPKSAFAYDTAADVYRCPMNEILHPIGTVAARRDRPSAVRYRATDCSNCPMKTRCTTARSRTIMRFESDELKGALRQVMSNVRARQRYRRRQTMVEPVFGELRHIQNLNRFKRRGLPGATLEFALNCIAHNVRRYEQLLRAAQNAVSCLKNTLRPKRYTRRLATRRISGFAAPWNRSLVY